MSKSKVVEMPRRGASAAGTTAGLAINRETVENLIMTLLNVGFSIPAARLGPHWNLTPQEAKNIAEPLARILDRYDFTRLAGEYGDYIALIVALGVAIVPRLTVQAQLAKQKGGTGNVANLRPIKPNSRADGETAPSDAASRNVQGTHTGASANSLKHDVAAVIGGAV